MRIEALRKETRGDRPRVCARVIWEVADRPRRDLFFETTAEFADALTLNPNAFLLAGVLPAMAFGEKRIVVDGALCRELKENLAMAMGWLNKWYGPRPVDIQSSRGFGYRTPATVRRAGMFLSGGVDSLAALRNNWLHFPAGHPRRIQDALLLHGFDMGCHDDGAREYDIFRRTLASLQRVAIETGVRMIPLFTNARYLDDDNLRFNRWYHGAVLAAAAHVFSNRLASAAIGSSKSYPNDIPWGSHPLLDPYYSSTGLQVMHTEFNFSRLDKVRVVSQWPAGLDALRVCIRNPVDRINCGLCFKCIRTILELYVAGCLERATTFDVASVDIERVRLLRPATFGFNAYYLQELYPYLEKMGRLDLIRIIERRRRQYIVFYSWAEPLGLVKLLKSIDSRLLKSRMAGLYNRIF